MKKLDQLMVKSYLGPFVLTFFIALFMLVMQFLWKYVDDLVGKGLEANVIAELLMYASASLVPMALPLAILLSSIMVFGNLGEKYELAACKSAGISVQRLMRPLTIVALIISGCAFYFANNILPIANLKMATLIWDVQQKSPALNIKEGIFYAGIEGYTIRVGKKGPNGKLNDIMIYDHTERQGNVKLVIADSGRMAMTEDERYLLVELYNGSSYEEMDKAVRSRRHNFPFVRSQFKKEEIRFDLSSFAFMRSDEDMFKDKYTMMNITQLTRQMDTLKESMVERVDEFNKGLVSSYNKRMNIPDSLVQSDTMLVLTHTNILDNVPTGDRVKVLQTAGNLARSAKAYTEITKDDLEVRYKNLIRHKIEYHRKFTLTTACLVLFFIGAPLGAIIRKGGLGMPVVVAVGFFLLYYLTSITGEKFSREAVIAPAVGMWISTTILLPIGIFLTAKATTDSGLLSAEAWLKFLTRIFKRKNK
ncbi:MAG: LptF/LptG family permease [Flavobacteriales bacterium]|nr:LptF/LptG family permease [Flavobacteriales bacterium]MCB9448036.1 LptF/LptG family permease [Flavobacteriales bacterium]